MKLLLIEFNVQSVNELIIIIEMGTQQSKAEDEKLLRTEPKEDGLGVNIIIELKILILEVLKQFEKQKIDVRQIKRQIKQPMDVSSLRRARNFQGRINSNGQIYGICKFFQIKQSQCSVYIGQVKDGVASGRGLKIITTIIKKQQTNIDTIDKNNYQAYLLQNWQIDSSNPQDGSLIKKQNENYDYFTGKFIDGQYHDGILKLMHNDHIKMIYQGQFKNNQIHGDGIFQIPGKCKYKGHFIRETRDGFGEEWDYTRQTYYIGEFQAGTRHGYGELLYLNRDNLRLKGFWDNGQIKSKHGVYVNKNGNYLETIGDDINLL